MSRIKLEVLDTIRSGLQQKWMLSATVEKDAETKRIDQSQKKPVEKAVEKSQAIAAINQKYINSFSKLWDENIAEQISTQYDIINEKLTNLLLSRHPWLENEAESSQIRLLDLFLKENIPELLFTLLQKNKLTTSWQSIPVNETSTFTWDDLESLPKIKEQIKYKIEGYPLSNNKFYEDRALPSFLSSPFTISPTRYDIYRLLKSTYPDKFKPTKLAKNIFCAKIIPLNFSELNELEPCEWEYLETILLNVGTEDGPEWVILDKKNGNWTLYTNEIFNMPDFTSVRALERLDNNVVVHSKCENADDWHAVLLSRILPWTQQNPPNVSSLENFRSNVPIEVLKQNTIESSCLTAQKDYINKARQAFALYYPLSNIGIMGLYETQQVTDTLFPTIPTPEAKSIILAFEENKISYDGEQIIINDAPQIIEAMKIAYHLKVEKIKIFASPLKKDKPWFNYNLELTSIISPQSEDYGFIHACAARNRFIKTNQPYYLQTGNEIENRKNAWVNTGKFIYDFFKSQENSDESQLRNIAEMGQEGLDNFFVYLNGLEQAPNLSCCFDLNNGSSISSAKYLEKLKEHIEKFANGKLFKDLELILPDTFDVASQANFFSLLKALDARHELTIIKFKNTGNITTKFLKDLNKFVSTNAVCLQITIPEWDAEDFSDNIEKGDLKAQYREVQNTILSNIRTTRQSNLDANTETITKPEDVIKLKCKTGVKIDTQKWRKDVQYQLASASVGVQQQAQQEVAQEAQQKQDKQSKPQTPTKRAITNYEKGEDLISRENLQGVDINDFSGWVGSNKDVPHLIQKIDASALAQIQKFPTIFKFGVDPERTPGFRLFYTSEDDKSLILSFDESLVEQDLLELKEDPFAVRMNDCKDATPFYGDFRQFEPFAQLEIRDKETCWHFLSEEKDIPLKVIDWIRGNGRGSNTSEAIQCYNYTHQIQYAKDQADMLKIIKTWSGIEDEEFLNALVGEFTPKNLKAFGQLFYHYSETGNAKWLKLTHQIYERFKDKFSIFKERLLDPLNDWSECLEQSEVKALTTSIKKLDGQPVYANILWELINAHGESVGRMRFAEVWRAYEKVIDYINANDLDINEEEFLEAIQKYHGKFNATQFLRRIYEVLQSTANRQDSDVVQQEILNNLNKIDWNESGFYYACINEGYRYWDADLKLMDSPSYISKFDDINLSAIDYVDTYTLRYAAQHLKLNKADFNKFKEIIKKISDKNIYLMRLLLASVALGIDSIEDLETFDFTTFNSISHNEAYDTLNKCLLLDPKDLSAGSYHVSLADLPILLKIISEKNLRDLDLKTINSLGRALQSFPDGEKEEKLRRLVECDFDSPLFIAFPWLVDEPINIPPSNEELLRFYAQLQTIDFKTSRLPNKDNLEIMLSTINSSESRKNAIKELIANGCNIADQDTDYRPLKPDEINLTDSLFLAKTFKSRNKALLKELFKNLAVKQGEDEKGQISAFLDFCADLDRKNYYNELGQLLGLLVEKSQGNKYYSVKQLTTWISSIFDEETFKNNPYPVTFIKELLTDALNDPNSSLLNNNLHNLKTAEPDLSLLKNILGEINLNNLQFKAKDTLVKFAIKFKNSPLLTDNHVKITNIFKQFKKSESVTIACSDYINQQIEKSPAELLEKITIIEKLSLPCPSNDKILKALWQDNQIKLFEELTAGTIQINIVDALLDTDNYTRMILIAAFDAKDDDITKIQTIKSSISRLNPEEKQNLAKYYATDPKPKLKDLEKLLSKANNATQIINTFEMVMQPQGKRNYSLEDKDAADILRVLNGIKLKGQPGGITKNEQEELLRLLYHSNNYCQVINLNQKSYADILDIIFANRENDTPEAKARILACIREVIVRKTGKWINHTQMLDLIYSALHNNDSLLHQIHMGEGKSIIGLARDVYVAMHGEIVDVYSSKESLSSRDHLDSIPVLEAFGIRHSHITASSEPDEYQNSIDRKGIGAVHYATIGNWSLFYSGVRWENKDKEKRLNVYQANRRSRCDEGDYVMRSENTLFNFSDQGDSRTIYNYDAWVYQIVYDFYMERQNKFARNDFCVLEDEDLQELYNRIADGQTTIAPDKSTFFQTYLATGNDSIRNNKLVGLITAAHLAQKLKNGVDFCIMNEQKKISDAASIDIRFAKVMINNQVYHGSTYSELVQQFLHVRLNFEAIKKHETPNFFIEPESEIALSANAKFILKNYYAHLEATTGTAGDIDAIDFYRDEFDVLRVIKMPTHEEIKTTFLAPVYTSTEMSAEVTTAIQKLQNTPILEEEEKLYYTKLVENYINEGRKLQVEKIIESITLNPSQPVLITCEDDREVEALGSLILKALENHIPKVVLDTNASGISEADILKNAGLSGAITISSRLGRGSDIKPYEKRNGLKVLRTYPATPEVVKQEEGRQGRNGAGGTCQDIINYNAVEVQLLALIGNAEFKDRLNYENEHLDRKIRKHDRLQNSGNKSKPKWQAIKEDEELRSKYLKARTLEYIKCKYKNAAKERIERKDNLLIQGSANVMEKLFSLTLPEQDALKRAWKQCRRDIETHWQDDDTSEIAECILNDFYLENDIQPKPEKANRASKITIESQDSSEPEKTHELIKFHQDWLKDLSINTASQEAISAIYGENCEKIDSLYRVFHKLSKENLNKLSELIRENPKLCHKITCDAWEQAVIFLADDIVNFQSDLQRIREFFRKNPNIPNTAQQINYYSQKFIVAVEGAPDIDFILDLVDELGFDDLRDIVNKFSKEIVYLCKNCMNEEDVTFFLSNLRNAHDKTKVLSYLQSNFNDLKQNPAIIRPLLPLLAQENSYPFIGLASDDETMPRLLQVLSKRPDFNAKEFNKFKDKIARIVNPENKMHFLAMLTTIPPFVSLKSILKDLGELPGLIFDRSYSDLKVRIENIQESATIFNNFLFTNDIITSMDTPYMPANKEEFLFWQRIYFQMPLENRKIFFTEIGKINNARYDDVKILATSYIEHMSNIKLKNDISLLQSSKRTDANKENTQTQQLTNASFFSQFKR